MKHSVMTVWSMACATSYCESRSSSNRSVSCYANMHSNGQNAVLLFWKTSCPKKLSWKSGSGGKSTCHQFLSKCSWMLSDWIPLIETRNNRSWNASIPGIKNQHKRSETPTFAAPSGERWALLSPRGSMGLVYPTYIVLTFYGLHVGQYCSPMDPLGLPKS